MELINAVMSSLNADKDKASFEMNMMLNNPTQKDAINKFKKALSVHSVAKAQIEVLNSIIQQVQDFKESHEAETNPTNGGD